MERLIPTMVILIYMGVKLGDIVLKRDLIPEELKGKVIAVDSHNILYQFLASIRTPEGYPLTDNEGNIVSHLKGLFTRTASFLSIGMKPIFIFDGEPNILKKGTLDSRRERKEIAMKDWEKALEDGDLEKARTKAQQTSRLTKEMVSQSKQLLALMGVPVIQAPGEGEAEASYLCQKGKAYAVSSQDFDSLLFGCPLLLRNLAISGKRKMPGRRSWVEVHPEIISLSENLNGLGIQREQLVDMAIMMGTDFNEGVRGIGPKKALSLIKEFHDLEHITKEKRLPLVEYDIIRDIFLRPSVMDPEELIWKKPDNEAIYDLLVDRFSFGSEGVKRTLTNIMDIDDEGSSQVSLDAFF